MIVDQHPLESVIARRVVLRGAVVAPIIIAIFWVTRGWQGAWSSTLGLIVVMLNFLLAGAILSISARISLQAYHAAAFIGFFLRLGLFVGAVAIIASLWDVDRLAFGVSAIVGYLSLLTLEAVAISRNRSGNSWSG